MSKHNLKDFQLCIDTSYENEVIVRILGDANGGMPHVAVVSGKARMRSYITDRDNLKPVGIEASKEIETKLTSSPYVRTYKTKKFTVSVEHHRDRHTDPDLADFKWVRIYANQSDIGYKSGSRLLLGCESGATPSSTLIKAARKSAQQELARMKALAEQLLALDL